MVAAISTLASRSSASAVEGIRYIFGTHGVAELDHAQAGHSVALHQWHGPKRFAERLVDERTQRHAAASPRVGLGFGMKRFAERLVDERTQRHAAASPRVGLPSFGMKLGIEIDGCSHQDVASARKHGVAEHDMIHAYRNHWRTFETDDVEAMTKSREDQAAALEAWADSVEFEDLQEVDTASLRAIAEVVDRRDAVDKELWAVVRNARLDGRSWSEIATMLGVSKRAAQQKYGPMPAASWVHAASGVDRRGTRGRWRRPEVRSSSGDVGSAGPALGDVLLLLDLVEGLGAVQAAHVELGALLVGAAGLCLITGP
jgi:hypothetical protein